MSIAPPQVMGCKHGQVDKKSSPLHCSFEVFHEINVKVGLNEKNHRCKCMHVKGPYKICTLWIEMKMKPKVHFTFIVLDETHGFFQFLKIIKKN